MPVNIGPRGCHGLDIGPGFGTVLASYNEVLPPIPASEATD